MLPWLGKKVLGTVDRDMYERIISDKEQAISSTKTDLRILKAKMETLERDEASSRGELQSKKEEIAKTRAEVQRKNDEIVNYRSELEKMREESKFEIQRANDKADDAAQRANSLQDKLTDSERKSHADILKATKESHEEKSKRQEDMIKMQKDMLETEKEHSKEMMAVQKDCIDMMKEQSKSMLEFQKEMVTSFKSIAESLKPLSIGDKKREADTELCLKTFCAVMIDNFEAREEPKRWVSRDEGFLKKLFQSFGTNVEAVKKGESLEVSVEELEEENFSSYDGIVVVVFAPGSKMILNDGSQNVSVDELFRRLMNNDSLDGKPKIVFVNAISNLLEGPNTETPDVARKNTLLFYYEVPEKTYITSFSKEGSSFVKALYEAFKKHSGANINKMLEEVEEDVMTEGVTVMIFSKLKKKVCIP